jgi:lipid A 3-O-deacylase
MMRYMLRMLVPAGRPTFLSLAALVFIAPWAVAADAPEEKETVNRVGQEVQLFLENDILAGTDRYYTNGFKVGFGVPGETLRDFFEGPAKSMLDLLSAEEAQHHFGLFIGQNLYTPRDIKVRDPQPNDRPWVAWLYLGGVAQRVQDNRLDTVEIDVGMVGPAAIGEQVQSAWHSLVGAPQPLGWDNQIPNEPAFLVAYLHKRRFGNASFDVVPHVGATFGTVMTLARAGGVVRFGRNMTGFGPDTIESGGAMLQNTRREYEHGERADSEWYGFIGADVRYVAHNVFLDGTRFRASPGVDRRNTVRDFTVGMSLRYRETRVSLTRILRSEEFTTPVGGGGTQSFYSLNLGLEF